MPIPDYQTVMLPLLRIAADGREHTVAEVADVIARQFNLTEAERAELLPSGGSLKLFSRVGWARTYLAKAGLLENPSRGKWRITARGTALLKTNVQRIDINVLNQFPEFVEFRERSASNRATSAPTADAELTTGQTPQELLESSYQTLHTQLAEDLLVC